MSLISLQSVTKTYGRHPVLEKFSGTIKKGEFVSLTGVSGSGKTTLLKMITGLDQDYEGRIMLQKENLKAASDKTLARLRAEKIGIMFQLFHLFDAFSLEENVFLPALFHPQHYRKTSAQLLEKARDLLKKVGLSQHQIKSPSEISGGQIQRVALARALFNDPDILILDEPTSFLDHQTQADIGDIIRKFNKKGGTVIISTHAKNFIQDSTQVINLDAS